MAAATAFMLTLLAMSQGAVAVDWQRASLGTLTFEYRLSGTGEPVVFVHAGIFADWFDPLVDEPALRDAHTVLVYHRIGYAGSSSAVGHAAIAAQARQLAALM